MSHKEEQRLAKLKKRNRIIKICVVLASVLVVIGAGVGLLVSYFNRELPTASVLYEKNSDMMETVSQTILDQLKTNKSTSITIYYETMKTSNGQVFRIEELGTGKDDKITTTYYKNLNEMFTSGTSKMIEKIFYSTVTQINAIRDAQGGYVCVYKEEPFNLIGSSNQLAYTQSGKDFETFMEQQKYKLVKKYSDKWFYFIDY